MHILVLIRLIWNGAKLVAGLNTNQFKWIEKESAPMAKWVGFNIKDTNTSKYVILIFSPINSDNLMKKCWLLIYLFFVCLYLFEIVLWTVGYHLEPIRKESIKSRLIFFPAKIFLFVFFFFFSFVCFYHWIQCNNSMTLFLFSS